MEKFTYFLEQKRIRRFNLRRCAFAAIFLCAASSVFAQGYPETSYKLSDDKTVLEIWKGDETDIDMNSDANLKGVNEIADYAFDGNTNVKSIVIGENVKTIGAGAFLDCTSLEKVVMPDGLETIGRAGFSSCTELKNVVLPTSLKSMGNSVFYNCAAIDKIIIPAEVTSVPDGAFNSCYSLSSVTFGDKVETIGEEAFKLCSSLTEISFPVSLKEIGTNAFVECSQLSDIHFNTSLETIGKGAFSGCGLTSLDMSGLNALQTVKIQAFLDCAKLSVLVLPDHVVSFASGAFQGCISLTEVTIPDSYKEIGVKMFSDCSGLLSVSLGSRVSHIGTECFSGLSGLQQFSVYAVEPPSLGSYVFNLTPVDKCKLLVPEESIDKYKEAEQWKDFMTTTTSITSVSEGQMPLIRVVPGMLNIDNMNDGSAVSVYTLAGQKVYSAASESGSMSVALQSGMYVVCINDVASKVLIP